MHRSYFFFAIFFWILENFFANNLNTTRVIVDVSDLLSSEKQIIETQKEFCFLETSSEIDYGMHVSSMGSVELRGGLFDRCMWWLF